MKRSIFKLTDTSSLSSEYIYTTSRNACFKLNSIAINFLSQYNGEVQIKIDSSSGSSYDVHILDMRITDHNDFFFVPENEIICLTGDEIKVIVQAAVGTNTAYLTIVGEDI